MTMFRLVPTILLVLSSSAAWAQDFAPGAMMPGPAASCTYGQPAAAPAIDPLSPYASVPAPMAQASPYASAVPQPVPQPAPGAVAFEPIGQPARAAAPCPTLLDRPIESTWYYRLDAFYWNERVDGVDFVNESGPISTIGYQHRNGPERYRIELFGGTVSYDGSAQFDDGTVEPYHESFGTNYLGVRAEYDLLFEPPSWTRARFLIGVGTRFWIRDLKDAVTPSGAQVSGYTEEWWTFYPYIGLETKPSPDAVGPAFYGSVRFGITPLTHQYATYFDTALYPRCGLTGQSELGVRYRQFAAGAFLEAFTWGESAIVRDSFQPASRMLTIGGKLSYTF